MKFKRFCGLFCLLLICVFTTTMFSGCKKAERLSNSMVTLEQSSYIYDGTEKKPQVTIKIKNKVVDGKNYTLEYFDNVNVGTATVRIVSAKKSKYIEGTLDVHFSIVSAGIGDFSAVSDTIFNGENQVPSIEVVGFTKDVDYTLSWEYKLIEEDDSKYTAIDGTTFVNAGNYKVTATGKGNFAGTKTLVYTIGKAQIGEIAEICKTTYSGKNQAPKIEIAGFTENVDFVISCEYKQIGENDERYESVDSLEFVNAGSYKITATGKGNYTGETTAIYIIEKTDYQNVLPERADFEYLNPNTIEFSSPIFGTTKFYYSLSNDFDEAIEFTESTNFDVGTYYFYSSISSSQNYNEYTTAGASFSVTPFNLENTTIELSNTNFEYTGLEITPIVTVKCKDDAVTLVQNQDYDLTFENNIFIGNANVIVTGKGNFIGTKTASFEIVGSSKPCEKHTPSSPITEKYAKPSVSLDGTWTDGGYDTVIYCSVCGTELERTHTIVNSPKINISLEYNKITYTGNEFTPQVNITDLVLDTDYEVQYKNNVSSGTAEVYVTFIKDYSGTVKLTFEIEKLQVQMPRIVGTYTYNGTEQVAKLNDDSEYFTVSDNAYTDAGEYIVTITLVDINNYAWENGSSSPLKLTFIIEKAQVQEPKIVGSYVYTGDAQAIELNYYSDLFETSTRKFTNAGEYQITVSLKDKKNYKWTSSGDSENIVLNFEIAKQEVVKPTLVGSYTYNWESQTAKFSNENDLIKIGAHTFTDVGEYEIKISLLDKDNYKWKNEDNSNDYTLIFTIEKLDLSLVEVVLENEFFAYTGNEIEPSALVKLGTKELVKDLEYSILYKNNIAVGVADVVITGVGNFSGEVVSHFTIGVQGIEEPTLIGTYIYNGNVQTAKLSYTSDKFTAIGLSQKNAGEYEIIISLTDKENYIWTNSKTNEDLVLKFVIEKYNVTEPTLIGTYTYTGENIIPTFENVSEYYEIKPYSIVDSGEYYLTISLIDKTNYEWLSSGSNDDLHIKLVVLKIEVLEPTIVGTYIYDGTEKTAVLSYTSDLFTVSGNKQTQVGTYKVQVSLKDEKNYIWKNNQNSEDLNLDFVIGYKDFSEAIVKIEDGEFVYDGRQHCPVVEVTFDGKVLEENFDFAVEYSNNINSGTGTITIYGLNNYSGTIIKTFEILKAKLEKPTVTGQYEYTGSLQTISLSYRNNAFEVENDTATNAGDYEITISLKDKNNYSWADGSQDDLTLSYSIEKASVTAPSVKLVKYVYNGNEQEIELDNLSELFTVFGDKQTNAGDYKITISLKDKDNYKWKSGSSDDFTLSFKILPYEVEEPSVMKNYEYTGELQVFVSETEYYSVQNGSGIENGVYLVIVTLKDKNNYIWKNNQNTEDLSIECAISKVDLQNANVALEYTEIDYTGEELKPNVTVKISERTLTEDDYSIEYKNNIDAGTALVVITGKNNYTGTITINFKILSVSLSSVNVTLSASSAVYNNTNLLPEVIVKYGDKILTNNVDYTYTWEDSQEGITTTAVNAGSYKVVVVGRANYTFNTQKIFTIEKASLGEIKLIAEDVTIGLETQIIIDGIVYGGLTIYYKNVNASNYEVFTNVVALPLGEYTAYAVIDESQNYLGLTTENIYFKVTKCTRENITISKDSYIFGNETQVFIWNYDGDDEKYYYYADGMSKEDAVLFDDSTIFEVGKYYIFAVVPESDTYFEYVTSIESFVVSSKVYEKEIEISRDNYEYGKAKSKIELSNFDGDYSNVKFYYNVTDSNINGTLFTESDELDAGTYYIYAIIEAQNGYEKYLTKTNAFTISKANYDLISVVMGNVKFGESLTMPTISNEVYGDVIYYYSIENSKANAKVLTSDLMFESGTYYVYAIISESQNYNSYETELTSFKVLKNAVVIPVIGEFVYSGYAQTALTATEYYTVSNEIQIYAGTYDVVISLVDKDNYTWDDGIVEDKILKFTIQQLDIENVEISLSENEFTYDGNKKEPEVEVIFNDTPLSVSEYSVEYLDNTDAGVATVIIHANSNGNFVGSKSIKFTINKAAYCDITLEKPSHNYGQSSISSLSGEVFGNVTLYYNLTNSNENGTRFTDETVLNAGVYYIYAVISESKNYQMYTTVTTKYEVYKLNLKDAIVTLEQSEYYVTGDAIEPNILTAKLGDIELKLDVDYVVSSYIDNINVGTAKIILTALDNTNFEGTKEVIFEILSFDLKDAVIEIKDNQTQFDYNGSFINPEFTVKVDGNLLTQNIDYTVSYYNNMNVGTASIVVSGIGNYSGEATKTFEIVGSSLESANVYFLKSGTSSTTLSEAYSGTSKKSTIEKYIVVEIGGSQISADNYDVIWKINGEVVTNVKDVGIYEITITEKSGGSFSGTSTIVLTYKITQKRITNASTVKLTIEEITATGNDLIGEIGVRISADELRRNIDYTIAWLDSEGNEVSEIIDAGTYTAQIQFLSSGNYSYSKMVTLTLTVTE